ncbi:MAG: four helix bundle protein [Planctomycetes bacterium]|nr:four helix bundle protein [Planctomycetota bacterium]
MDSKFSKLRVWQKAREVVRAVYVITAGIHDDGLRDQMRRAAISIVSNIAEGAGRRTDADFRRFLSIARGSCSELQAQLVVAADCRFIDGDSHALVGDLVDHTGRMISSLMQRM